MRVLLRWFYNKFGEWVSDRISGILWFWVLLTGVQTFNALGVYDATFVIMRIQQVSEVLDWVWYIDSIFSFVSLTLWFMRKSIRKFF